MKKTKRSSRKKNFPSNLSYFSFKHLVYVAFDTDCSNVEVVLNKGPIEGSLNHYCVSCTSKRYL